MQKCMDVREQILFRLDSEHSGVEGNKKANILVNMAAHDFEKRSPRIRIISKATCWKTTCNMVSSRSRELVEYTEKMRQARRLVRGLEEVA